MSLLNQFENYLKEENKVSEKTLRNYRSDIKHFLSFSKKHLTSLDDKIRNLEDLVPHFNGNLIGSYKGFHISNFITQSTSNRRLSTVRNFGKFLTHTNLINEDHTELVSNMGTQESLSPSESTKKLLGDFARQLKNENVSHATLKNYVSDVKHFLNWVVLNN